MKIIITGDGRGGIGTFYKIDAEEIELKEIEILQKVVQVIDLENQCRAENA